MTTPPDSPLAGAPSPRTRVRRVPQRADYSPQTIAAIAREALLCHVAFVDEQGVHSIPTNCWTHAGHLYLHGAVAGRMVKALAAGEACVSLAHVDGLVFGRSALHHSMNYRSVVAYGRFEPVDDAAEKLAGLEALIEAIAPGRWAQVRPPSRKELAATAVLRLPLTEAAAKTRTGGPKDDVEDMAWPVWAGVVPMRLRAGAPQPEAGCEAWAPPVGRGESEGGA